MLACVTPLHAIAALIPTKTSHLKCLNLQSNEIGKSGAVVLSKVTGSSCTSAEGARPVWNKYQCGGLPISEQTSILANLIAGELDVGCCNLTAEAISALAPTCTNTSHLKCFIFEGNEIGKTGAVVLVKSYKTHAPLLISFLASHIVECSQLYLHCRS